ncbi:TIR domain-containing protein [Mycobacterium sp. ACS4331]|uniref:TIR domain-containing protein n=1 Tax=Mycobacterium sp. ACS4331 TaxID=1834121 RepID=UPI0009EF66EB|nr:TIR domain-containing protein [Mycobacterium sp. ACS4331]
MAQESGGLKVFISWSGALSKQVATVWRELLVYMFDAVAPFMSEADIGAGERGLPRIESELADTIFGIIVVTRENQTSPWLNFEAGALSKNLPGAGNRVAPSLVDFSLKSDATGPLAQFQANLLDRDGVQNILVAIAKVMGLNEDSIRKRFINAWDGEFEAKFAKARESSTAAEVHRPEREVLDEIVTIAREWRRKDGGGSLSDAPMVPLDIPVERIRDTLSSFSSVAGLPAYLAPSDDGNVSVVIDIDKAQTDKLRKELNPLADELIKIGVSVSFRAGYSKGR